MERRRLSGSNGFDVRRSPFAVHGPPFRVWSSEFGRIGVSAYRRMAFGRPEFCILTPAVRSSGFGVRSSELLDSEF
jgi:hypothetical protein